MGFHRSMIIHRLSCIPLRRYPGFYVHTAAHVRATVVVRADLPGIQGGAALSTRGCAEGAAARRRVAWGTQLSPGVTTHPGAHFAPRHDEVTRAPISHLPPTPPDLPINSRFQFFEILTPKTRPKTNAQALAT